MTSNSSGLAGPSPRSGGKRLFKALLKTAVLFLSLAGCILFARFFDLDAVLEPDWAETHIMNQGAAGPLLFMGTAALLSAIGAPRQALAFLGGYAFGAVYGVLWTSLGLTLGCACGFFYARILARSALQTRFSTRLQRFNDFLSQSPFMMTMAVRCFPFGSNVLTNILAGVSALPALPFIGGSSVGYLPQTVIFSLLGSGLRVDPWLRTAVSALLFILSSLFGWMLYRKYKDRQPLADDDDGGPQTDAP